MPYLAILNYNDCSVHVCSTLAILNSTDWIQINQVIHTTQYYPTHIQYLILWIVIIHIFNIIQLYSIQYNTVLPCLDTQMQHNIAPSRYLIYKTKQIVFQHVYSIALTVMDIMMIKMPYGIYVVFIVLQDFCWLQNVCSSSTDLFTECFFDFVFGLYTVCLTVCLATQWVMVMVSFIIIIIKQ